MLSSTVAYSEDTLEGRDIRILVPTEIGGDAYTRPFGEALQRHFPKSSILIQSETTAGGKVAARILADHKGQDIVLGLMPQGLLFSQLLGEEGVAYDFEQFRYVGSLTDDRRVLLISNRVAEQNIAELARRESPIIFGVNTLASSSSYDARMLNALLGLKLKIVPGFKTAERLKAMIAGEIDAVAGSFASLHPLVDAGEARVVLRFSSAELPTPAPAGVPTLRSLVSSPWAARLADFIETQTRLGRLIVAAPTTSEQHLQAIRSAFDSIVNEPLFQKAMSDLGASLDPESGQIVETEMRAQLKNAQSLRDDLTYAIGCGLDISDGKVTSCVR